MKIKIKELSPHAQHVVVWVLRVIVGGLFIFSGMAKAIDPWGGLYKITEYFASLHTGVTHETALVLSCLLSSFEFTAGVMLLVGAFRRTIVWLVTAFVAVMTLITVWIFFANPVSDCGCFGDFLVLSNGATLAKNLVLCLCMVALLKYNHKVEGAYHFHLQWMACVFSATYAIVVSLIGYFAQPIIDFRPYKVGTNIEELMSEAVGPQFVYKKGSEVKTFSVDNLPDDSWTFVERKDPDAKSAELAIYEDGEDVTLELFEQSADGGLLMLLVTHPDKYGISRSRMANRLYDYMRKHNGTMVAVVPDADQQLVQQWIDDVEAKYDVYTAEDTDLKAFARGNAALVYIKDNVIKWKYNIYALSPEIEAISDVNSPDAISNIEAIETQHIFLKLTVTYLIIMLILFAGASMPIALYKKYAAKKIAKSSIDE
jgi:uncharacterized membrane protein YphA (DoxX/SURF4 family)